jgi:hypothetical protein
VDELKHKLVQGFARALGDDPERPSVQIEEYVRKGSGPLPGRARLLSWDANSIHGFVFDTTNATGIRGASVMLKSLGDKLLEGEAIGIDARQVLFAGGGLGMAVVGEKEYEAVIDGLHRLFAVDTLIATCSTTAVGLEAGIKSFSHQVQAADQEMRQQRAVTGAHAEPAVPFIALRCQVCGKRAASSRKLRRGNRERAECEPCFRRIEVGKKDRKGKEEAPDFDEIADRDGFFAVVYIDGNAIGKRIRKLSSPLDLARFSRTLMEVMNEAFNQEIERYGLQPQPGQEPRYQLPICAGDDLVAILPGEVAVPMTRDLMRRLENELDARPGFAGFGTAAGIAIGKATFPVRHLLDEAEALLDRAKQRVYQDQVRSAITFAVVTDGSPRAESAEVECWHRGKQTVFFSGLPYSLEEMEVFFARMGGFTRACIGRSQLYQVRRHARHGPEQLRNHILFQIGRHEDWQRLIIELADGDEQVLGDADRCLAQVLQSYGDRRVLDIGDMIELQGHWREPEQLEEGR